MVSEKIVFMHFHFKPIADNDTPGVWPVRTPGTRLAGFIKRRTIHCYTHHMEALGLVVPEKNIFFMFSHCKAIEANGPQRRAIFDPRCMIGSIYTKLRITMPHPKYRSFGSCGFREEDCFLYFQL